MVDIKGEQIYDLTSTTRVSWIKSLAAIFSTSSSFVSPLQRYAIFVLQMYFRWFIFREVISLRVSMRWCMEWRLSWLRLQMHRHRLSPSSHPNICSCLFDWRGEVELDGYTTAHRRGIVNVHPMHSYVYPMYHIEHQYIWSILALKLLVCIIGHTAGFER